MIKAIYKGNLSVSFIASEGESMTILMRNMVAGREAGRLGTVVAAES